MRDLTDKLLGIGVALYVLAAPAAFAGTGQDEVAAPAPPLRIAQAPATVGPGGTSPGGNGTVSPPIVQDQAQQSPAAAQGEAPRPFHGSISFESGSGKILTLAL